MRKTRENDELSPEEALYRENLELFALDNRLEAYLLDRIDCSDFQFCYTNANELNLKKASKKEASFFFHAPEGARLEAHAWFDHLSLKDIDALTIFGVGLGYYYEPLKQWLAEDARRVVIFLEDDPRVLRCFLHTPLATEMLKDPQVIVRQIPKITFDQEGWTALRKATEIITFYFGHYRQQVSALQAYFFNRFETFYYLAPQWFMNQGITARFLKRFTTQSRQEFQNFYKNVYRIADAVLGSHFFSAFESVPVIICGAGPSLTQQIPLLRQLEDQALIFAGGTAVNILSHASVPFHAAGAIDPTEDEAKRYRGICTYGMPLFYQPQLSSELLEEWQGPLIYYPHQLKEISLFSWFDQQIGSTLQETLFGGVSVSNFLVELCGFFRADPIILVGLDLAYTGGKRYASGVHVAPSESESYKKSLEQTAPIQLSMPGYGGVSVQTTPQWFLEACCIGEFHTTHPETALINATEGGMTLPSVPDMPLKNLFSDRPSSCDLQGIFHSLLQVASEQKVPLKTVKATVQRWKKSLLQCKRFLKKQAQAELEQEEAYIHLLHFLELLFNLQNGMRLRRMERGSDSSERLAFEKERRSYLLRCLEEHIEDLQSGWDYHQKRKSLIKGKARVKAPVSAAFRFKGYIPKRGKVRIEHPSGKIFIETYFKKGVIHGPWICYDKQGNMLYFSYYRHGKREGMAYLYYAGGKGLYGKKH